MTDDAGGSRYFEEIEAEFVRLRGAPLLLSPEDWRLADSWKRLGVPAWLVLDAIRDVFRKRAERAEETGETPARVNSLAYCRPAVEKAWAIQRDLQAGARPPIRPKPAPIDVAARLRSLAAALPDALEPVETWRRRVRALDGAPAEVEEGLADLEFMILDREMAARDEERAREALGPDRPREIVLRHARRLARERLGMPKLSLFSQAATAAAAQPMRETAR